MRFWFALPLLAACGGDDVPLALAEPVVTLEEDTTAGLTLDGDPVGKSGDLVVEVVEAPEDGELSVSEGPAPLDVTYTPPADWAGATTLSFTVTDSKGRASAPRTVSLVVNPVDDAPNAVADVANTDSVTAVVVRPLDNDTDIEGDPFVVDSVGTPSFGAATVVGAATVRYEPQGGTGAATFSYTVRDEGGATAIGQITVNVTAGTALVIDRFEALPAWPLTGQPVTLVWETTGATACALDHGASTGGATSGSTRVVVSGPTIWTLTCQGPGGPLNALVSVDPWPTDTDGDGLSDLGEMVLGGDPLHADTDRDGLPDGSELATEVTDSDSDDDGWPDGLEDLDLDGRVDPAELDPTDPDTNGDGICDGPRRGDVPADPCTDPAVWYVDAQGTTTPTGTSWANPFRRVTDAIVASSAGDHIWVAGGDYKALAAAATVLDVVNTNLAVVGGFSGGEEWIGDRPWPLEETVLEGDFDGDGLDPANSATVLDNARTVVHVVQGELTLVGLTITGGRGRPDTSGMGTPPDINAGIDATDSVVRVIDSRIDANLADRGAAGGGDAVTLSLARTVVTASDGAGACLSFTDSDLVVVDSALVHNDLPALSMAGGSLEVVRSRIEDNPSATGAFYLSDVDTRLFDTDFVDNENLTGACCNASALTVTGNGGTLVGVDVAFFGNQGGFGAVSVTDVPTTLTNATFVQNIPLAGNTPPRGGAITGCNATILVRNTLFQGNGTFDARMRNCTTGAPVVTNSVSNLVIAGNTLATNAWTTLPSGEIVLFDGGAGVDLGAASAAEDPVAGYPAFDAAWTQRAATDAFAADVAPVDVGRHLARDRLVILEFDADADDAWWDVSGARSCDLSVEGVPMLVMDAPTTGDAAHGATTGDDLVLTCDPVLGARSADAAASVP